MGGAGLAALMLGAGMLAGCGANLGNESTIALASSEAEAPKAGAGLTAGPSESHGTAAKHTAEKFVSMATPGNKAYKIGPQDVLDISVFKVPELTKTVQVAESGSINLPLVGEVPAAGKTAEDIERNLTKKLGAKYLQSPQVTVFVKEYNSQRVTVDGAVKKPGVYPIRNKTSLMQIIATAEGLDRETASSEVVIFRNVDGKRSAARFNLDEIRAGRAEDPQMQQGDVVVADTSTTKIVLNTIFKVPFGAFAPLL